MSVQVVEGHLGGYVAGGDEATWYPDLWEQTVEAGCASMLDVGCGEGLTVDFYRGRDVDAFGVEGIEQRHPWIAQHDYTSGLFGVDQARAAFGRETFDLVWCCEFVEHVEERHIVNYLATFKLAQAVLLTHAEPGQLGHHHVNYQPSVYWSAIMAGAGFREQPALTTETRRLAAMNQSPFNHYARAGLAFVQGG